MTANKWNVGDVGVIAVTIRPNAMVTVMRRDDGGLQVQIELPGHAVLLVNTDDSDITRYNEVAAFAGFPIFDEGWMDS